MIYTSYYAQLRNLPNSIVPIAISLQIPSWYNGKVYKKLAPTEDVLGDWWIFHDPEHYACGYYNQVIKNLDVNEVQRELFELSGGKDVALLCYEKSEDFCHRHFVRAWFNNHDIECEEWKKT